MSCPERWECWEFWGLVKGWRWADGTIFCHLYGDSFDLLHERGMQPIDIQTYTNTQSKTT